MARCFIKILESILKKFIKSTLLCLFLSIGIFCTSCSDGKKIVGHWESPTTVSYDFDNSLYTMKVNIIFTVAKISGPYRISGDSIYMTAEKISFDDGQTWNENDGEIFPREEQIQPFAFNDDGTISISNVVYKKN